MTGAKLREQRNHIHKLGMTPSTYRTIQSTFCESEATAHFHPAGKEKSLQLHREDFAANTAVVANRSMLTCAETPIACKPLPVLVVDQRQV